MTLTVLAAASLGGLADPAVLAPAAAQPACPSAVRTLPSDWPPVDLVPTDAAGCPGYWIVSSRGDVFSFGGAGSHGSTGAMNLARPIVSMAATPDGAGYWLVSSDGGVFSFGDAGLYGSAGGTKLNQPVVGMTTTPDGGGYWLVSADGGVFSFGDAGFYGSAGGMRLAKPIVGIAATPDGAGYWLAAADGGVFAFGDAGFYGSAGGMRLAKPVVAIVPDPATGGYWLAAADGGVFNFNAPFVGSAGSSPLRRPMVAAAGIDGAGYDLLGADGGVFTFGPGPFLGTAPGPALAGTVIAIDPGHDGGNASAPGTINQPVWNGTAYESCDTVGSETASGYSEHQFNWNVAQDLAGDLEALGATVVLTRPSDDGVGPCVNQRAAIANASDANAAVSIHGDGGPPGGRGFTVLEPVADGVNNAIVSPSRQLAADLRNAFAAGTDEPVSDYYGVDGIEPRDDLAGLNLSTVPKVLIECVNMPNPTDAAALVQPAFQHRAAAAIAQGLSSFVAAS